MLPKNNRIIKGSFDEILKKGAVLHSPLFLFRFQKNNGGLIRAAFVASKKVASLAAERNKLRRRGYSALRAVLKDFAKPSFVGVFFFKKGAEKADFQDYKKEIAELLKKASVL